MNTFTHAKHAAADFLQELKLGAMEVLLNQLQTQTHRLLHALLQGPESWRLQLQELAGVQSVLDTTPITKLIASDRSEVAKKACGAVAQFAEMSGTAFAPFADVVLPSLVSTAPNKVQVFRQAGKDCLTTISTVSKYDMKILVSLWRQSRTSEARCLIVQQVTTVVRVWPKSELAEHCDDVLLLLSGAIQDPKDFVRAAAREALCAFAETWYGPVYHVVA
ncbi:hypothetical protein DYB25_005392 [Aphanomyces astaci]|uniref:CLASP N-terminal domain-containing protein n=2 Tax=Aphanomyces astaci TaxID=112090 RepID=A0A397BV56_APHAT|nr:hypothetical protein DYB25_005392 [Aphanomyces astaci]RHY62386.1 hypothetical protein DYB30_001676 [Aphanomyces astaci]RHY65586.1 hypothetical protein DYB38_001654 [Aphanomyces astaci]